MKWLKSLTSNQNDYYYFTNTITTIKCYVIKQHASQALEMYASVDKFQQQKKLNITYPGEWNATKTFFPSTWESKSLRVNSMLDTDASQ